MAVAGIRKAVIPAAGRGTRMQPFSHVVPKELVPLGSRPVLDWILDEALEAGAEEIALIVGPHKGLIHRYVRSRSTRGELEGVRVVYVEQDPPRGLAEAIALCAPFAAGEPFSLLLPDNLFPARGYSLRPMLEAAGATGLDVVGIIELGEEATGRFGNCGLFDHHPRPDGLLGIDRLRDKQPGTLTVEPGQRVQRTCGRYVFQPHVFDCIDRVRPEIEGEFSEVPVFQRLLRERGGLGCVLEGPLFDVGNPAGHLAACAHLHEQGRVEG